jgi:hypothetical protein
MKEVIISAFARDFSWISELNSDIKVTVYRKGVKGQNNEVFIENNVGRDVHTFFYHFVKNYDNLYDYTLTSQDYFEDHVSNYIEIMNGNTNTWDENSHLKLSDCWFFNTKYGYISCDKFGNDHHPGLDIESIWNQLFLDKCPIKINFVPAGHFCVSKKHVLKRPIEFYKKILNILETDESSPWIIERLESYIFDLNYEIKL